MRTSEPDPNILTWFRGGYRPLAEANVNILTHALHYGTGVFEGIRGIGTRSSTNCICAGAGAFRALEANCGIIRIDIERGCPRTGADRGGTVPAQPVPDRYLHEAAGLEGVRADRAAAGRQ
jgi:hypothetical protein